MAKKKKSIDLSACELFFELDNETYKAVRFYPSNMTVDAVKVVDGKKSKERNFAFAHLPKKTKQQIKPK